MIKIKFNIVTSLLSIIMDNSFIDVYCVCGDKLKKCVLSRAVPHFSAGIVQKIVKKKCFSFFDKFKFNNNV